MTLGQPTTALPTPAPQPGVAVEILASPSPHCPHDQPLSHCPILGCSTNTSPGAGAGQVGLSDLGESGLRPLAHTGFPGFSTGLTGQT